MTVFLSNHFQPLQVLEGKKTKRIINQAVVKKHFEVEEPLFFRFYTQLLDCADWFRSTKNQSLMTSVEGLVSKLSEETWIKMILLMCKNESNRSADLMDCYEELGRVYDHLSLYVHRTRIGTYVGTSDAPEAIPDIKLDEKLVTDTFSKLPKEFKEAITDQLHTLAKFCQDNKLTRPGLFQLWTTLNWSLTKS